MCCMPAGVYAAGLSIVAQKHLPAAVSNLLQPLLQAQQGTAAHQHRMLGAAGERPLYKEHSKHLVLCGVQDIMREVTFMFCRAGVSASLPASRHGAGLMAGKSRLHGKPSKCSVLCWLHASCRPVLGPSAGRRALGMSGPAHTTCSAVCRAACCGTGSWVPGPCPCRAGASPPEAGGCGGYSWLGCPLLRPQPEAHVAGLCQGDLRKATHCHGRLHAGVTQHLELGTGCTMHVDLHICRRTFACAG